MSRISIVIPYFQRKPGLLRRALESVMAQEVADDDQVEVIVVDDESPSPPEPEVTGLSRPNFAVRIVKQRNGGPAAARNAGLNAADQPDYVALLDSDDWWSPVHLKTGMQAMRYGAQFHFANHLHDEDILSFDELAGRDKLFAYAEPKGDEIYRVPADKIRPLFLAEYVAHTSTVMFDAHRNGDVRFDESQTMAGEDYLFWLTAIEKSDFVSFSNIATATRGRGIDLYRSALDWNNPECVRRLYYALIVHKKILARFCVTDADKTTLSDKVNLIRRGIIYLFFRNALTHIRTNSWVLGRLVSNDGGFWLTMPRNAYVTVSQKLAGRLQFPIG